LHYFHYQQIFEILFKFILETKNKHSLYSRTHKLNKLLEEVMLILKPIKLLIEWHYKLLPCTQKNIVIIF